MEQIEEKKRIGEAASQLVEDGETVFLSSGTTVLQVAYQLQNRTNLTIITNSLMIMNALAEASDIMLVGVGGILRSSEQSFIGHITEQTLAELRVDKVVMGVRAIDFENGLTNDYLPETQTDRAILSVGKKTIIVADHTKCARVSNVFLAPVTVIDTFITDNKAPDDFLSAIKDQGIRVLSV